MKNIGLDGSGENCKIDYNLNPKKFKNITCKIKINMQPNENIIAKKDISKYLKKKFTLMNKLNFFIKKISARFSI